MATKTWIGMLAAIALACAACGGSGSDQVFTEPCMNGMATHDFGSDSPDVLARVSVYLSLGSANEFCSLITEKGLTGTSEPVHVEGSVATAQCCAPSDTVTFVLEP